MQDANSKAFYWEMERKAPEDRASLHTAWCRFARGGRPRHAWQDWCAPGVCTVPAVPLSHAALWVVFCIHPAQRRAPQGHLVHRSIQGWGTRAAGKAVFKSECSHPNSALSGTIWAFLGMEILQWSTQQALLEPGLCLTQVCSCYSTSDMRWSFEEVLEEAWSFAAEQKLMGVIWFL